METRIIKEYVFSGGHLNAGIQFASALHELYEMERASETKIIDTSQVLRYIGSSAGGIIAFTLAIGMNPRELLHFLRNFPFDKLLTPSSHDFLQVFDELGIVSVDIFKKVFVRLLVHKGFDKNITFQELREQTGRDLGMTTFCVNSNKVCFLNYTTTPHLQIAHALCMTMAIPFLFKPVSYENRMYVDTICINSFPLEFVKSKDNFLGFTIQYNYSDYEETIKFTQYLNILYSAVGREIYQLKKCMCTNPKNIIVFASHTKYRIDFKMTKDEIEENIESGKKYLLQYLKCVEKNNQSNVV